MASEVETREFEPLTTVCIRTTVSRTEIPNKLRELLEQTRNYLKSKGVEPSGPAYAQYYAFGAADADFECGWPVDEDVEEEGDIEMGSVDGGKGAVAVNDGPYATQIKAHGAVHGWLHTNGTFAGGFPREVYLKDPTTTDEAEWRTEVIWPMQG
jgi:effector-binding domain-containing protein